MSIVKNNAVIVDTCSQRLAALEKHLAAKAQIAINGVHHPVSALIAIFKSCLDTRAALLAARGVEKKALSERQSAEKARLAIENGLKAWVIAQFGATSPVAHEFGYGPKKARVLDVKTKARAVALAQATREARHTLGKKQKKKIKGAVVVPDEPAVPAKANGAVQPH
jgi:hypothetical protein